MSLTSEAAPIFLTNLKSGLRRCEAIGKNLLVAISGGADSVALLRGLLQLQPALNLTLRAAHLNHQLRGADADADAAWVRSLCERFNVPCEIVTVPVRELAEQTRRGLEETARDARYDFLRSTAARHHCDVVATAHTADDQAETVLHHILRGTGLTGLRGMEWSRSLENATPPGASLRLIRPLLATWRIEIEQYLDELNQDFRLDATNRDVSLTRNRLRHELLPHLEREFNPRVREHLCQLAEQAADDDTVQRMATESLLQSALLDRSDNIVRLGCDELAKSARPLVRELFVRLWQQQQWQRLAMTYSHWDRLADLVHSNPPAAVHLPGKILASRRANLLVLERQT
jgi:tRNA(Ile)-lysidine synthase